MNEREEQVGERQPQGDKPNNNGMIEGAKSFIRRMCHNKCEQDKCVETKTSRPRLVSIVDFKLDKIRRILVTRT